MVELGYKLSSEEHGPRALVDHSARAEAAGFSFGLISDHFHPWIDKQGESPFVWSVVGAIAQNTTVLKLGTGVTCPTIRIHPAIIAQAAATSAALMPRRFFLGVGSGENLNEHILGDAWPAASVRLEMLEEAIGVIRLLWKGGLQSHHGKHYTVENARLYSLPEEPPPIYVAASGSKATELAGRAGDGMIGVAPDKDTIEQYESAGGRGKSKYAEVQVCYHEDEKEAQKIATEWWPNIAMGGQLGQDLALPSHYEAIADLVSQEDVAKTVACGPDPEKHLDAIQRFIDAGYDHLAVHQIGPHQEPFFSFYETQILPRMRS
jgi:coenzyme F420-dependent glucose-6-phosphate dehydrogenase